MSPGFSESVIFYSNWTDIFFLMCFHGEEHQSELETFYFGTDTEFCCHVKARDFLILRSIDIVTLILLDNYSEVWTLIFQGVLNSGDRSDIKNLFLN